MGYFLLGSIPFVFGYFPKLCCGNVVDEDVEQNQTDSNACNYGNKKTEKPQDEMNVY